MKRLLFLALFLAACGPAAPVGGPGSAPATTGSVEGPYYALQDAQATGTAAARSIEATATAQVNLVATEARASIALAEAQTQAAIPGMQTATAVYNANLIGTATEGAAFHATQLAADLADRDAQRTQGYIWIVVGSLAITAVVIILCREVIRVGRAYESKVLLASIVLVGKSESPVGYFLPGVRPKYFAFPQGPIVPPQLIEGEPKDILYIRAWREAVVGVARAASLAGSWSVNTISTRHPDGEWPEDTVARVQAICDELGAIVKYGGTRGWDWAPGWNLIDLEEALESGILFTLPRKPPTPESLEGTPLMPVFPAQSKTKPSKATEPKQPAKSRATI